MKTPPWQRMKTWKGGWIEGVATVLKLECYEAGRPPRYAGEINRCRNGCACSQEELRKDATRKRPALDVHLARRPDGTCIPVGEVPVGGEENRVTYDYGGTPQVRMPKALTLAWFMANGWKGSTVERRGDEVRLIHPSGARMRLRATALEDVE